MLEGKWGSREDKLKAKLNADGSIVAINCTFNDCPLFQSCAQTPGQVSLSKKTSLDILFLFDAAGRQEQQLKLPASGPSGILFREQFLAPLKKMHKDRAFSYELAHVVRGFPSEKGDIEREASDIEVDNCWQHLKSDLLRWKPKTIVALGIVAFAALRRMALNRSQLPARDQGIEALRGKSLEIRLTADYTAQLICTHSPSAMIKTPSALRYFFEDRKIVHEALGGEKEAEEDQHVNRPVLIEKIEVLETVKDSLDFLRMLRSGSLDKGSRVAFDTETFNLNRRYNNDFLSWQFTWREGEAVILPINHPLKPIFADPADRRKLSHEANLLFNATREETNINWWVAHYGKFDLSVLFGLMGVLIRDVRKAVPWFCTHLALHWLDENRKSLKAYMKSPYGLKTIGKEFFGFQYRSEALDKREEGALDDLDWDDFAEYSGSDVILTHRLPEKLHDMAKKQGLGSEKKLLTFIQNYYWPTIHTIALMECNGMYVSRDHLKYMQGERSPIWTRVHYLEKEGLQERPEVLAFREKFQHQLKSGKKNSHVQFYEDDLWGYGDTEEKEELPLLDISKKKHKMLFFVDWLKFKPLTISKKTNEPSFAKKYLEHYAERQHFLAEETIAPYHDFYNKVIGETPKGDPVYEQNSFNMIIELSAMKKLGTTYLNALQGFLENEKGDAVDNRVRAYYQPAGTDTGRLSSSSPNLQNIPSEKKSKAAGEIKNIFQAEPPSAKYPRGTVLIQVDYAGAEVVWAVNFSGEPGLVSFLNESAEQLQRVFTDDEMSDEEFEKLIYSIDFHRRTASLMFNIPVHKVDKYMRQASKALTFGILYGKTVKGLAADNGWSEEEAQKKLDMFFEAFPKLKQWLSDQQNVAKERGYVETFMSRRRRLQDFYRTGNFRLMNEANRKAMNSSIQGQSSDAGMLGVTLVMREILLRKMEHRWLIQNMVHDAILLQVPREDVELVLPIVKRCLTIDMHRYIENHWKCKIPVVLRCDFDIGVRYGDLVEWNQRPSKLPKVLEEVDNRAKKIWGKLKWDLHEDMALNPEVEYALEPPPAILDLVSEYRKFAN